MGDWADLNNDEFKDMDEDIIELTDQVYDDKPSQEENSNGDQDIIELVDVVEEVDSAELGSLQDEHIEAVLEKMILDQYGDKIDDLLLSVMEKVIQKEIYSLKKTLMKELGDVDSQSLDE